VYNDARKLFKGSVNSGKIIGRDKEKSELAAFISKRIDAKSSGCIYVSGPPGTGKSALVKEVCDEIKDTHAVEASYYSCVSAKSANDIYAKLLDDFGVVDVMEGAEIPRLKDLFRARAEPYLVILDEIDHLLEVDLELLYQLFEWSLQKTSSLILVGIANALDLTDRFLPKLKSKGLKPLLLPFMPYTVAQIASVVSSKLNGLLPKDSLTPDFVPLIHPTAILFASKKVAAQTGDIRKAFAVCLRALDLIEAETRVSLANTASELTPSASPSPSKTPLMENINLSSPSTNLSPKKMRTVNPLGHLKFETAPRATIAHMARVTASVFSNGLSQRLSSLNLQQRAALCALSALETSRQERQELQRTAPTTPSKSSNSAPTVRVLYDAYSRLCKRDNVLQPLALTEFRDIVVSLETLSMISWADSKNGSLAAASAGTPSRRGRGKGTGFGATGVEDQKVVSCVGVKELKASLSGPGSGVLLAIVDGDGL
jgi:cell division control protein 6